MATIYLVLFFSAWSYVFIKGVRAAFAEENAKPSVRPYLNGISGLDENLEKLPSIKLTSQFDVALETLRQESDLRVVAEKSVTAMNVVDRTLDVEAPQPLPDQAVVPLQDAALESTPDLDPHEWIIGEQHIHEWD